MDWTDERVTLLRQRWLDGQTAAQIAAELGGTTRNAVVGKVYRLGLVGRGKANAVAPRLLNSRPPPAPRTPSTSSWMRGAARGNTARTLAPALLIEAEPACHDDVMLPQSLRVIITDLGETMCRWPFGDPTEPDFRYCGIQTSGEGSYCPDHGRMAYQPTRSPSRQRERKRAFA